MQYLMSSLFFWISGGNIQFFENEYMYLIGEKFETSPKKPGLTSHNLHRTKFYPLTLIHRAFYKFNCSPWVIPDPLTKFPQTLTNRSFKLSPQAAHTFELVTREVLRTGL